jgi:hypothetical protein
MQIDHKSLNCQWKAFRNSSKIYSFCFYALILSWLVALSVAHDMKELNRVDISNCCKSALRTGREQLNYLVTNGSWINHEELLAMYNREEKDIAIYLRTSPWHPIQRFKYDKNVDTVQYVQEARRPWRSRKYEMGTIIMAAFSWGTDRDKLSRFIKRAN